MEWPFPIFERLLVAVLVGLLIGLDRERAEIRKARPVFAGVRTFPLIAVAGAAPMILIPTVGAALLVASFLAVAGVTMVSYVRNSAAGEVGATTEMAAIATFLIGALAGAGELVVAGATGVLVAVLLVAKPRLEGFSRALSEDELAAVLELGVITVIVLPLLPNRGFGPWQVLNPFEIWLVVVLVSGLSFTGFVAARLWGERRGITITGIAGALVSSTAVTAAMASQSRASAALAPVAAAAAVLASTIMCVRVAVLAGAINIGILGGLVPVVLAMSAVGAIAAWILGQRVAVPNATEPSRTRLSNPFSLTPALTFGIMYAVILVAVRAAEASFGTGGMYVAAVLSSLADVDAAAIAFARLGSNAAGLEAAVVAITVALVTNTLSKLAISLVMGAGLFRWYVAVSLLVMALAGSLAGLAVAWF